MAASATPVSPCFAGDHGVECDQQLAELREASLAECRTPLALGICHRTADHRDERPAAVGEGDAAGAAVLRIGWRSR
jgi:hypothetical protein